MAKTKKKTTRKYKKQPPKIKKNIVDEFRESIKAAGSGTILSLDDEDNIAHVKSFLSTQSLELDYVAFGSKGLPSGRTVEIYGPPHIGKSTILDHLFAEVQRVGGEAVLIDAEAARAVEYTKAIGVDTAKLHCVRYNTPDDNNMENVMTTIFDTIDFWSEKAPDVPVVIGWDALGSTATREEVINRLSKADSPGMAARVMRKAARQLSAKIGNTNITLVILNHEYEKINAQGFGKKRETYGGAGVRHLATVRLCLFNKGYVKLGDNIIGRQVGVKVEKDRLWGGFGREGTFALISGSGISNIWTLFERLRASKIIITKGSWSAINLDGEELKFQGWSGLADKCEEDPTLFPRLVSVFQTIIGVKG